MLRWLLLGLLVHTQFTVVLVLTKEMTFGVTFGDVGLETGGVDVCNLSGGAHLRALCIVNISSRNKQFTLHTSFLQSTACALVVHETVCA